MAKKVVSGASLEGIYERLNETPGYHPFEANTFSDWAVEAGDTVRMSRNGETIISPVHSSKMTWKGAPEMTLSATGSKEREPVSKVARRKYGGGGAAIQQEHRIYEYFTSSDGYLWSAVYMSESMMYTHFDQASSALYGDVHSEILQTASQIYSTVYAANSTLYSYVNQTASGIEQHVANVQSGLHSEILQTASQIYSSVYSANSQIYTQINQLDDQLELKVGKNGVISAINMSPEEIKISADKIILDGTTVADVLKTQDLIVQSLEVTGEAVFHESIDTPQITSVYSTLGDTYADTLTVNSKEMHVYDIAKSQDGSTLTIYFTDREPITFNKAASIEDMTGSWSGGILTVETVPSAGINYKTSLSNVQADVIWDYEHKSASIPINAHYGSQMQYTQSDVWRAYLTNIPLEELTVVSNNTYYPSNNKIGFSRVIVDVPTSATVELSGRWSNRVFTAVASPGGQSLPTSLSNSGHWGSTSLGENPNIYYYKTYATIGSGATLYDTGNSLEINASARYTAAEPASGIELARHGSGYNWDFQITKNDGSTKNLTIDVTNIYRDARLGYTLGIFTPTNVTVQGEQADGFYRRGNAATAITVRTQGTTVSTINKTLQGQETDTLHLRGTAATTTTCVRRGAAAKVYKSTVGLDTATTLYKAGTKKTAYNGNGGSFLVQGTEVGSVTKRGTVNYFRRHAAGEKPTAAWYEDYGTEKPSSGSYVTFYKSGGTHTYYKKGTEVKYDRGSSYETTPIGATKFGISIHTYYDSGSTLTYYPSSKTLFQDGGTVKYYKAGQTANFYSTSTTLYKQGTVTTYYPATATLYRDGGQVNNLYYEGTVTTYYRKT